MISISTDASSYRISPLDTITITIADTTPPAGTYTVDVSFDGGGTWSLVTTFAPLGGSNVGSMDLQPTAVGTSNALMRVTNPETAATANSAPFTLVPDQIIATPTGFAGTDIGADFTYQSDAATASTTSGDAMTMLASTDTTGGNEAAISGSFTSPFHGNWTFADNVDPGGSSQLAAAGDAVWDRPGALFTPPQGWHN